MNKNLIDNRQIRVFISSTFRDMQDERDYLMRYTFPRIREIAAERDVTVTELDLRWGITQEDTHNLKLDEEERDAQNWIDTYLRKRIRS